MKNWKDCLNFLKSLINHTTKIFIAVLLFQAISFSQQDSTAIANETAGDSVFVMHKSPWGAVLRSAIVPGWGQIYNESYLKAPVVWGIFGALAAGWIHYNNKYKDSRDLYITTLNDFYRQNRDFYRDQRDLMGIYIGLAYFLNLVDAYVDAQLFDFTVKENNMTRQPWLNIKIRF